MNVDVFYDVFCDVCGRSLSQNYACGLFDSKTIALKEARRIGFFEIKGKRVCPACGKKIAVRCMAKKDSSLK